MKKDAILLLVVALALRLWSISQEFVPNTWDEQYHLVVAKNMMENPLHPKLMPFAPLEYDYKGWSRNETWLHKPPFFLWLMAGSMKLFGANLFAGRLPSALMGAFLPLIVLALGDRMGNRRAGLIGGWWLALGHFGISLVAGRYATDHNDVCFSFLVGLSVLLGLRYTQRSNPLWAIGFGLSVGLAILTKWMPGLLAIGILGLSSLLSGAFKEKRFYIHALLVGITILACVLPWNMHIHSQFPLEAAHEAELHSAHLTEAIEGHDHPWWFHMYSSNLLYGWASLLLIPLGILLCLRKSTSWKYSLATGFVLVYVVFSFAQTKMQAFTYMVAAPAALYIGWAFREIEFGIQRRWKSVPQIALVILFAILAIVDNGRPTETIRLSKDEGRQQRIKRARYASELIAFQEEHAGEKSVFVGVPHIMVPLVMWYTDGTAYMPSFEEADLSRIKEEGYLVYTFENLDGKLHIIPK